MKSLILVMIFIFTQYSSAEEWFKPCKDSSFKNLKEKLEKMTSDKLDEKGFCFALNKREYIASINPETGDPGLAFLNIEDLTAESERDWIGLAPHKIHEFQNDKKKRFVLMESTGGSRVPGTVYSVLRLIPKTPNGRPFEIQKLSELYENDAFPPQTTEVVIAEKTKLNLCGVEFVEMKLKPEEADKTKNPIIKVQFLAKSIDGKSKGSSTEVEFKMSDEYIFVPKIPSNFEETVKSMQYVKDCKE